MAVADSLPLLIGLLADPDAGVRRLAARALGRLGADGALAAPALHTALADNDRLVARAAAEALAEEESKNRVGVETVIVAWVRTTPPTLRADIPRLMEKFGLDADEYRHLLD